LHEVGFIMTQFYIHSEPQLFHYNYYTLEAKDRKQAREKFDAYLDSTVHEIYPKQAAIETEKYNSNITVRPFQDQDYEDINEQV